MSFLYDVIGYLFLSAPLVIALLLGLLLPVAALFVYQRFGLGLFFIILSIYIDAVSMGSWGLQLFIRLYPADVLMGFVGGVAAVRYFMASDHPPKNTAWLFFMLAFVFSTLTGLAAHGTAGGVSARGYFYAVAGAAYVMSFPVDSERVRQLYSMLVVLALCLVSLTVCRWIIYYTPIYELLPPGGVYNVDGAIRVVGSDQTLIIAQACVLSVFFAERSASLGVLRIMAPVLFAMVIVLQHRSVWLASMIGVMAALFIARSRGSSKITQLFVVLMMVGMAAIPLAFSSKFGGVAQQVGASARGALSGQGTVDDRAQSWKQILKKWAGGGPRVILLGHSFGTDNTRYVLDSQNNSRRISYAAHNFYVQTLDNLGLVGLLAFLSVTAYAMRGLYRLIQAPEGDTVASSLLVLLIMQLAYYVPYNADYLQLTILGMAVAYVASRPAIQVSAIHTLAVGRRQGGLA